MYVCMYVSKYCILSVNIRASDIKHYLWKHSVDSGKMAKYSSVNLLILIFYAFRHFSSSTCLLFFIVSQPVFVFTFLFYAVYMCTCYPCGVINDDNNKSSIIFLYPSDTRFGYLVSKIQLDPDLVTSAKKSEWNNGSIPDRLVSSIRFQQ